jgi:hypothetical protein
MSWALPDVRSLEVNWGRVRTASVAAADKDYARLAELVV